MKKQETVERNFQKNIEQWKVSRDRRIDNLCNQKKLLEIKIKRCKQQIELVEAQIEKLKNTAPPSPPSEKSRTLQLERMKKQYPSASDDTLQAIVDYNINSDI